jgi:hypothetical protein
MSNVSRRSFVTSTISPPISLSLAGTSFVQANDENDEFWYVSSEFRPAAQKIKKLMKSIPAPTSFEYFRTALSAAFHSLPTL